MELLGLLSIWNLITIIPLMDSRLVPGFRILVRFPWLTQRIITQKNQPFWSGADIRNGGYQAVSIR
jgi:hypothetical protein